MCKTAKLIQIQIPFCKILLRIYSAVFNTFCGFAFFCFFLAFKNLDCVNPYHMDTRKIAHSLDAHSRFFDVRFNRLPEQNVQRRWWKLCHSMYNLVLLMQCCLIHLWYRRNDYIIRLLCKFPFKMHIKERWPNRIEFKMENRRSVQCTTVLYAQYTPVLVVQGQIEESILVILSERELDVNSCWNEWNLFVNSVVNAVIQHQK